MYSTFHKAFRQSILSPPFANEAKHIKTHLHVSSCHSDTKNLLTRSLERLSSFSRTLHVTETGIVKLESIEKPTKNGAQKMEHTGGNKLFLKLSASTVKKMENDTVPLQIPANPQQ